MTYNKKYEVRLFRRYLKLCAAEYSVITGDDHCILCIGLLRWAKFPRNNLIYICFEFYPPAAHPGNRWQLKVNDEVHPDENALSTPVTTLAPYATAPMDLFADGILSKLITDLLKKPSSRRDEWRSVNELRSHATEICMDMGPTPVENYTFLFLTVYLHSWAGETKPIQDAHRASCLGLVHWAAQPNKHSIYLVTQSTDGPHLNMDDGDGYSGKLWRIRLINAATDSIPASPPPAPPLPDDDPPEDEQRKDKAGEIPGPSELFRAMERLSSGWRSTSQGGATIPAHQSSSTVPQHNLGLHPDSVHSDEPGKTINIPPGFIDPAAHVEEDVDFGEDYSSDDNSDGFVPPRSPPDSPPPPSPPGSPHDTQTSLPCGDPVVNQPTAYIPPRYTYSTDGVGDRIYSTPQTHKGSSL